VIASLLARLDVLVGWLADLWYRTCYGWDRHLLGCRRRTVAKTRSLPVPMITIACTYSVVLAKAVKGVDRSNIQPSQGLILGRSWPVDRSSLGVFDGWQNLTGHIAYRIFDQLPVKYPVPRKCSSCTTRVTRRFNFCSAIVYLLIYCKC